MNKLIKQKGHFHAMWGITVWMCFRLKQLGATMEPLWTSHEIGSESRWNTFGVERRTLDLWNSRGIAMEQL